MCERSKILIDVDTDVDAAIALVIALQRECFDLLGITIVHGNANVEKAWLNTLRILKFFDSNDIRVVKGAVKPLTRNTVFYSPSEKSDIGLENNDDNQSKTPSESKQTAWDFMYEKIQSVQDKVTICLLGPCTNAALLIRKYPEIINKIERFVFSGGSHASGTATPVATDNAYYDPDALQELIHCGVPFFMADLEATKDCFLRREDYETFVKPRGKELPRMLCRHAIGVPLHKSVTLLSIACPEIFHFTKYKCEVELLGEITLGMTVIYKNGFVGNERFSDGNILPVYVTEEEKNVYYLDKIDVPAVVNAIITAVSEI